MIDWFSYLAGFFGAAFGAFFGAALGAGFLVTAGIFNPLLSSESDCIIRREKLCVNRFLTNCKDFLHIFETLNM